MKKRQTIVEAEARLERSKREAQTVVITQAGGASDGLAAGGNVFSNFLSRLMAENTTFGRDGKVSNPVITEMTDKMIASALGTMNGTNRNGTNGDGNGSAAPATLPTRN